MCGIAGIYGFRNDNIMHSFSKDLAHRGPDGEGFFFHDRVSLLNRRLAIIDRTGGDQPIFNEDKSVAVVYNGEIYNYKELRIELEKAGHIFRTHSDTEVIVHGYEQWGEHAFDRYNGMFAVALYDIKKDVLVLARDHFGIKPLYFAFTDPQKTQLVFASEIRPILQSKLIPKRPNDRVIFRYLQFRIHDDGSETFFEGINKLLPGEIMVLTHNSIQKRRYTSLQSDLAQQIGKNQSQTLTGHAIEKFRQLLRDSVRDRLISEVPVGTCLSGGLDSSTVAVLVNSLLKDKVSEAKSVGDIQNTFSAIFPGAVNDEKTYIDEVVRATEVKSHTVSPKPENFFNDLSDFIRTQEEPTISTGPYAQYKVMQIAHKTVTVVLDGQGADEMMAGYLPYYFVYLRQLYSQKKYITLLVETVQSRDIVMKYCGQKLFNLFYHGQQNELKNILSSKFIDRYANEKFSVISDNLKARLLHDIFENSLPSLLRYEDKNSMRFSIEGRVPFLDYKLVRYLFSLPDEAIIKNGWNKYILRTAMKQIVPNQILERRNKIGFTTPEQAWFLHMKNRIYTIFLSESFAKRPYFNQKQVLASFQSFIEGKVHDTLVFWRALNIELWLREFIDSDKPSLQEDTSHEMYAANAGKHIQITYKNDVYQRYPVRTDVIQKGDHISPAVTRYTNAMLRAKSTLFEGKQWGIVLSEKIVAIAQGRSYFLWEIHPTFLARILSGWVKKTPFGIGLGSPWTMQLAINEVGTLRILFAAAVSAMGKSFGFSGLFYHIVGPEVASIDGPTEYSLYPSNVSAKLGPKNPDLEAQLIRDEIRKQLHNDPHFHRFSDTFAGVAIIDANDLGRKVLGSAMDMPRKDIEAIFADNPMGQSNEQTPMVVVTYEKTH